MRVRTLLLCMALAAIAGACAKAAPIPTEAVTEDYVLGSGKWDTGGGITIVAKAFEQNGETVVCGAWATDQQSIITVALNDAIMGAASVYSGETRLVQNLKFMAKAASPTALIRSYATCVTSRRAWQDSFATDLYIRIPRQRFTVGDQFGKWAIFTQTM